MARRFCPAVVLFVLAALPVAADAPPSHGDAFTDEGLVKANVATLKDTEIVAQPNAPLPAGKNVIWCGTFQLAWNEAVKLIGEKPSFTPTSPLVEVLNKQDFTGADLDPSSYVAVADFERNHVEDEIRTRLEKTFHGAASPELIPEPPANPAPDDFLAYAYLFKNLAFAHPFSDGHPLNFGGTIVKTFSFPKEESDRTPEIVRQVAIDDYQSENDFIIQVKTKAADDQLILAKVAPGATLQATIDAVLKRISAAKPVSASPEDEFLVPKLNYDLKKEFTELEGLVYVPGPGAKIKSQIKIDSALQLIRFQLNEKGAVLKSEAVIAMRALAIMRPHHTLIFDQPFLILMKQAGADRPYFAMWVANGSLLVPAEQK